MAPKTDNYEHNLYYTQHKWLPHFFYGATAPLMRKIQAQKGQLFVNLFHAMHEGEPDYHCPIAASDFDVTSYIDEDQKILQIIMPNPCKSSTMSTLSFYHISEKISPKVVQLESRDSRNSYNTNTEVFLMNTRQKLHQIHLNEWATRFADQKASGLTVRQWCDQNNYSVHTYNYWKHILKEELANQVLPDIVPITIPEPVPQMLPTAGPLHSTLANSAIRATAKLSVNGISIEFDSTASEEFLRTIIKAACYA